MTVREAPEEEIAPRWEESEDASRAPSPRKTLTVLALLGLLSVGVAVELAMVGSHRIHWNSDQAIVGLMARHIQHGVQYPAFYYGSAYAGTLESTYMAVVFSVAGSSVASYRASLMILLVLLSLLVYAIGRRVFGVPAALLAIAYLAVPPFFFLYKGLTSDGAYVSLAVIGAGLLYGAVRLDEAEAEGRASLRWFFLLGFLAGLGWWVLPLIVYFYIAIGVWFLIVRHRVFVGVARQAVFLSAFLLGSARWWLANASQGWPSLHASQLKLRTFDGVGRRVLEFFSKGLPCLLGARPTPNYSDLFPGASTIAVLVFTGTVLSTILFCVRYRASRGPREHGGPRQARTLLLLLLSIVAMQVVVAYNPDTYLMDPRYLYPFYAPFALLFGFALTLIRRTRFAWAAIPIAVGVLALNGVSLLRAPRIDLVTSQPADVPLDYLVGALDKLRITDVYTSYWTGYRLAFESEERIQVASFGEGVHRSDRYPPYAKSVALSSNPGFILWGEEAERFRKYLRARGSGAKSLRVGMYEVFWEVSPAVVREMAELRRVPSDGP